MKLLELFQEWWHGKPQLGSVGIQTKLRVEPLEQRTLLSVVIDAVMTGPDRYGVVRFKDTQPGDNSAVFEKLPDGSLTALVDNNISLHTTAGRTVKKLIIIEKGGNDCAIIDSSLGSITVVAYLGAGADYCRQEASGVTKVWGQNGSDMIIVMSTANCYLDGGNGNDFLQGGSGNDRVYGRNGDDVLVGCAGNDYLDAGNDDDCLYGGDGNDSLVGGRGEDTLYGGFGVDVYNGGCHYVDTLYMTSGEDRNKPENDKRTPDIIVWNDPTRIVGPWTLQNGTLTVDWSQQGSGACITAGPSSVNIQWNGSTWSLTGVSRFVFYGSPYDDSVDMTLFAGTTELHGAGANDTLKGGQANDVIFGDGGDDWLYGGPGSDQITGGDGQDQVWGGTENDFVYLLDGQFGDAFNDKNPGDFLEGDGSSVSMVDQQYDPYGQWWLLRGTTVTVTASSYVDPLSRVPAYVDIAGEARGLHFFASSLRVEVPSLSAFTIDTLTRNSLLSAGFQIEVIVVSGGGVDPLNC
ncbi:MAG: calcium-binding protein [Candidatus Peribacteraceae bacterium]|nr:calcium-binding protein [Candidatus Peribacteraceae bacterium]